MIAQPLVKKPMPNPIKKIVLLPETVPEPETTTQPSSPSWFQAIGVVRGVVNINGSGQGEIMIRGKTYPLIPAPQYMSAYYGLSKELKNRGEGDTEMRLAVYPKIIHFPKGLPYRVAFAVVAFDAGRVQHTILQELADFEFKLSGLWQFIPVCTTPCVSVFRNFTPERLDYIKQAEPARKVKFMKASHLPVLWKDAPIRPFRFNSKIEKDKQGKAYFVEIKTTFLPNHDAFGFVALTAPPLEKPPRFLKASKQDKAAVNKSPKSESPKSESPKSFNKPVLKRRKESSI